MVVIIHGCMWFWWSKIIVIILRWWQHWTVVGSSLYLMWWIVMVGRIFSTTCRKCKTILMITVLIAKIIWTMVRSMTRAKLLDNSSLRAVSSGLYVTLFGRTRLLVRCSWWENVRIDLGEHQLQHRWSIKVRFPRSSINEFKLFFLKQKVLKSHRSQNVLKEFGKDRTINTIIECDFVGIVVGWVNRT